MARISQEEKIRQTAREVAKELIDTATAAAAALAATTASDISYIKSDIAMIKGMLDNKYVTRAEFSTVKIIAYGLVGLICTGVVGGLLLLLFKTNSGL